MILSMTGYGRSDKKGKNFSVSVEIKSINNRFYDPIPKIHPFLKEYEIEILSLSEQELDEISSNLGSNLINAFYNQDTHIEILNNEKDHLFVNSLTTDDKKYYVDMITTLKQSWRRIRRKSFARK